MLSSLYFRRCMVVENSKMKKSCKVHVDESEPSGGKLAVTPKHDTRYTAYSTRLTTRHTTQDLLHKAYNTRPITHGIQHKTYNTRYTAQDLQYTAYSTRPTTHGIQHKT